MYGAIPKSITLSREWAVMSVFSASFGRFCRENSAGSSAMDPASPTDHSMPLNAKCTGSRYDLLSLDLATWNKSPQTNADIAIYSKVRILRTLKRGMVHPVSH
jgi:hypothetical protein